jgi:hypothetical protein
VAGGKRRLVLKSSRTACWESVASLRLTVDENGRIGKVTCDSGVDRLAWVLQKARARLPESWRAHVDGRAAAAAEQQRRNSINAVV